MPAEQVGEPGSGTKGSPGSGGGDVFVICELPSSVRYITTYANCKADGGTVVGKADTSVEPVSDATVLSPQAQVVYTIRSGSPVVGSVEDAQTDGGKVVARVSGTKLPVVKG